MAEQKAEAEKGEGPGASYQVRARGPGREDMVASYIPDSDEWVAKTGLELNDPGRVAVLRQFGTMFPEVSDLQVVIDEFLDEFLKARTSIEGASREEYQAIFEAMYGGGGDENSSGRVLAEALAGDLGDD